MLNFWLLILQMAFFFVTAIDWIHVFFEKLKKMNSALFTQPPPLTSLRPLSFISNAVFAPSFSPFLLYHEPFNSEAFDGEFGELNRFCSFRFEILDL